MRDYLAARTSRGYNAFLLAVRALMDVESFLKPLHQLMTAAHPGEQHHTNNVGMQMTALHEAAVAGHEEAVRWLLTMTPAEVYDHDAITPFERAQSQRQGSGGSAYLC